MFGSIKATWNLSFNNRFKQVRPDSTAQKYVRFNHAFAPENEILQDINGSQNPKKEEKKRNEVTSHSKERKNNLPGSPVHAVNEKAGTMNIALEFGLRFKKNKLDTTRKERKRWRKAQL